MTAHRKPPLPKAFWRSPAGQCRWCGEPVLKDGKPNKRRNWHDGRDDEPNCLELYMIVTRPDSARCAVYERDKGICAECGAGPVPKPVGFPSRLFGINYRHDAYSDNAKWPVPTEPFRVNYNEITWSESWHVDHVIPLWKVDQTAPDAIRYWLLENLQTLCETCHKRKSKAEAAERAKFRRIRAQAGLLKPKLNRKAKVLAKLQGVRA